MNYKMMGRFTAQIIAIEMAFLLPALIISLVAGEWIDDFDAFCYNGLEIGIFRLKADFVSFFKEALNCCFVV